MNQQVQKAKAAVSQNIDKRIVVSTVVAAFVLGGVLYVMNKSNVKILKDVAKLAK